MLNRNYMDFCWTLTLSYWFIRPVMLTCKQFNRSLITNVGQGMVGEGPNTDKLSSLKLNQQLSNANYSL